MPSKGKNSSNGGAGANSKSKAKASKVSGVDNGPKQTTNDAQGDDSVSLKFIVLTVLAALVAIVLVPGPAQDYVWSVIETRSGAPTPASSSGKRISLTTDKEKRDEVVAAFKHAWFAYERDAYGADEYHPISREGTNLSSTAGVGYTIIDTLDTLLLFSSSDPSLLPSYKRARRWLNEKHTFDIDLEFNTFELTIRLLGGLLSADWLESMDEGLRYAVELEGAGSETLLLEKAVDLAQRLRTAFETPSGLPLSNVNLKARKGVAAADNKGLVSTAEVGTLQLEFRHLAHTLIQAIQAHKKSDSGEKSSVPRYLLDEYGELLSETDAKGYWDLVEGVMRHAREGTRNRLPSIFMNPKDGEFVLAPIRLGSRGDSYYEYLLKQYLQTGKVEEDLLRMYDEAMDGIHQTLMLRTPKRELLFVAELMPETNSNGELSWRREPKQDHLVCFLAGSLMLGAASTRGKHDPQYQGLAGVEELEGRGLRDWKSGDELLRTCLETHKTNTGLSPEIAHFRTKTEPSWVSNAVSGEWYIKGNRRDLPPPLDARYILRPETIESLFIAYRLTGDPKYRRWGWTIFQSIQKYCRIESGGYVGIHNVDEEPVKHEDKMETFFLSETLKYLYLLFSDESVLPLDEIVFNTEAHPLPRFKPLWATPFMSNANTEWKVNIAGWN